MRKNKIISKLNALAISLITLPVFWTYSAIAEDYNYNFNGLSLPLCSKEFSTKSKKFNSNTQQNSFYSKSGEIDCTVNVFTSIKDSSIENPYILFETVLAQNGDTTTEKGAINKKMFVAETNDGEYTEHHIFALNNDREVKQIIHLSTRSKNIMDARLKMRSLLGQD